MMDLILENLSTLIIAAVLIAVIICVIVRMLRDQKQGKSSCGCGCSGCAMNGACHGAAAKDKKK